MTDLHIDPDASLADQMAALRLWEVTRHLEHQEPAQGWPQGLLVPPRPIDSGLRVRELENHFVDVLDFGYNHRLVVTPKASPWTWVRGWCFSKQLTTLAECVLRAGTFDPAAGEEPEGWIKEPTTERRACGWYFHGPKLHQTYVAACEACGDETLS